MYCKKFGFVSLLVVLAIGLVAVAPAPVSASALGSPPKGGGIVGPFVPSSPEGESFDIGATFPRFCNKPLGCCWKKNFWGVYCEVPCPGIPAEVEEVAPPTPEELADRLAASWWRSTSGCSHSWRYHEENMVVELLINDDVYIETYGPPSRPAFSNGGYLCRDDIDAEGIWKITLVIGVDSPASIERVVYEVDPPPDNDVPISADDEEPCSCWAGKPMLGDGDRICNDQSKWSYCECEKLSSEDSADVDLGGWRHTEEPCVSADADDTPPSPPPAPVTKIHIVQRGENLYRISLCYGVTVEAIQVANGIVGTNIYVGQQLMIP